MNLYIFIVKRIRLQMLMYNKIFMNFYEKSLNGKIFSNSIDFYIFKFYINNSNLVTTFVMKCIVTN